MAMDQQVPVQYADLVSAAATETSYSAEQHQQQQDGGGLRAAVVGHGRVLCKPAEAAGDVDACLSCSAAGRSALGIGCGVGRVFVCAKHSPFSGEGGGELHLTAAVAGTQPQP
jgi:hypothetical protein